MDNGLIIADGSGYLNSRPMPRQDEELIRRLSHRWLKAVEPHNKWAEIAKKCVDMLEGRQWTEEEKAILRRMKRTALTLNGIAPLYRLVMGYQSSNRNDVSFNPTSDAQSSEDIGQLLGNVFKAEAGRLDLPYTDTDVFADGLSTGRGYWDVSLCFEDNDLGELAIRSSDPFSVYVDPDCQSYDISDNHDGAGYVQEVVWTSIDQINSYYGSEAALAAQNCFSPGYRSSVLSYLGAQEISPMRFFGQYADEKDMGTWLDVYYNDFIDLQAKSIRVIDSQYKVTQIVPCFVDLETGEKEMIPADWLKDPRKIEIALQYAAKVGNPLTVVRRPIPRVRRTVTCGDLLLYDDWSIYKDYTKIGYFPYFRRGATRGMIEDLIDPQREKNKKRSVLTDILNRNANSGWIYNEKSLDPDQEENLRNFGSAPGINVKFKTVDGQDKPQRIEPGNYPQGLDRIEEKSANDLYTISGINESALGQLDRVQSGRAIEARQRQAVLSIQMYSDNFSRSKKLQGRSALDIFQQFYTENRVFRIMGEDSSMATYEINKKKKQGYNSIDQLNNDITVGKYSVHVDEVPMSATFKQAQFEETMEIIEKLGTLGTQLAMTNPGLIIDQSSLPRKADWKKALEDAAKAAGKGQDPKIASAEKIAAAKNETAITVAALNGVKDSGLVTNEMLDIVNAAKAAGAVPQGQGGQVVAPMPQPQASSDNSTPEKMPS